jgi:hypothetical protein
MVSSLDQEARAVLASQVATLRTRAYDELRIFIQPQQADVVGESGTVYQVEIQAFEDYPRKAHNLRVLVAVDGGPISEYSPLTDSFIIAPDGSFIGEREGD